MTSIELLADRDRPLPAPLPNLGKRPSSSDLPGGTPPAPARGLVRQRTIQASAAFGILLLVVALVAPTHTMVLPWFIPAGDVALVCLLGLVAVLGCLDAVLRSHSRSLPLAAAAAGSALAWIPSLLTYPGMLPGHLPFGGAQLPLLLSDLVHIGMPAALAVALTLKPRPLTAPGRTVALTMLATGAGTVALIGVMIGLAPILPLSLSGSTFTTFSRVLDWAALAPISLALLALLRGHRGDERVSVSVAAALILLVFGTLTGVLVPGRYVTSFYVAGILRLAPSIVLMIGQLGLYARTVAAQVRDEAEIRRGEARTGAVIAAASEAFIEFDAAGLLVSWNEKAEELFGWGAEEIIGRPAGTVVPAWRHEAPVAEAPQDGAAGATLSETPVELTGQRRDGVQIPIEMSLWPVEALGTRTVGGFVRDISERKAVEASLARLASLVETSDDSIVTLDLEGRILTWNQGAERLYGYRADEVMGRVSSTVLNPPGGESLRAGMWALLRQGLPSHAEVPRLRKDGTTITVAVTSSPIFDRHDHLLAVSSISRDVTEGRRAQRKFEGLLESAPDAIVVVGADGLIRLVNRQTEVLFGYARSELVGQPVERLIPDRFAFRHPGLRSGYFVHPTVRAMGATLELAARRKDGSEFPVDISLAPLETEEGTLVSAAVRDVTERKRAELALLEREEQLAAARDQAQEASRLKSQFLANMSHEIRTPMNGVLGMAELLLTGSLEPEQRRRVENLRESGKNLLAIINDILDFSKVEAGKLALEEDDFDLVSTLRGVVSLLASAAGGRGLTLDLQLDAVVPRWVRGDSVRLRQILVNLLGNAVKFTERGGIAVNVTRVASGQLRFEVVDTGIGIDASAQAGLLEPFSQGDASTTRRFGGTGLGLAICRQLVELMGGRLDFSSEPGVGSSFWFEVDLPAAEARATAPPAGGEGGIADEAPAGVADAARILLADDVEVNREVGRGFLQRLGYQVDTVATGAEAVEAVRSGAYAAVLMDCLMPEMDGYQATRIIRSLEGPVRHIPIIAMTAAAMTGDRERCLAVGMDDYVSKPFDISMLTAALGRCRPGSGPAPVAAARTREGERAADDEEGERLLRQLRVIEARIPAEAFDRVCRSFLVAAPEMIAELGAAARAHDEGATAAVAHRLSGTAATFGAIRLGNLARQVEEGGRSGVLPVDDMLAEMDREYSHVHRLVTSLLPDMGGA